MKKNEIPPTRGRDSMVYTSHEREGQYGFTHPEGCPEGRCGTERSGVEQARGTSRGVSKPILSRPLVGGISFFFILSYHVYSILVDAL